jgi:hypothetical protein
MNLDDFKTPSKYLASSDIPAGGLDLMIASFSVEKLQDGTTKPAVLFTTLPKAMLLNPTNRKRLKVIFKTGETTALIGQRVGVYVDPMVANPSGDIVGGLRLRPAGYNPNPVPAAPVVPATPPAPTGLELAQLRAAQALQAKQVGPAGADPFDQEVPF